MLSNSLLLISLKDDGTIIVNPSYIEPKPQHYNCDMWKEFRYCVEHFKPIGEERVESLQHKALPLI